MACRCRVRVILYNTAVINALLRAQTGVTYNHPAGHIYMPVAIRKCNYLAYIYAFRSRRVRGQAPPRTFETICADHQHYIASGVDKKEAHHLYNCITEPIFSIPISQVSIDYLPRTELFCMITHTCTCMCPLTC